MKFLDQRISGGGRIEMRYGCLVEGVGFEVLLDYSGTLTLRR